MNCTSCGANLPQGAAQCLLCGAPTPYNVARSASSPQYDPTVVSSQPGPGSSPQLIQPWPQHPMAELPLPHQPRTAHHLMVMARRPPPPNPYNTPSAAPNPYGAPPPQQNIYGAPPQQGGYVAPPPQPGYGYGTPPPPKRRSRLGLILGIVALVLIVACAGISFAVYQGLKQADHRLVLKRHKHSYCCHSHIVIEYYTNDRTDPNVTPTTSGGAPSGLTIDPAAASIITTVQMASGVDSNYKPYDSYQHLRHQTNHLCYV